MRILLNIVYYYDPFIKSTISIGLLSQSKALQSDWLVMTLSALRGQCDQYLASSRFLPQLEEILLLCTDLSNDHWSQWLLDPPSLPPTTTVAMPCQRHLETPRILVTARNDELRATTARNLTVPSKEYQDMIRPLTQLT